MIQTIFTFSSHLLFIFFAHHLLTEVVEWHKFLKSDAEHAMKVQFFILFFSIALGYLVSTFFIGIYQMSRDLFTGTILTIFDQFVI